MLRRNILILILTVSGFSLGGVSVTQEEPTCSWVLNPKDPLQMVLDMAHENAVICLSPGLYGQGEEIRLRNAWLTLKGAGVGKTIIHASFSIDWVSTEELPWIAPRSLPPVREVRLTDLTLVPPEGTYSSTVAIRTNYYRNSPWKSGRIVLEDIEVVGFPETYGGICRKSSNGITLGTGMELFVKGSVFRGLGTALASYHYYPSVDDIPRITADNSHFYNNCVAIQAHKLALEMSNTQIEKNAIGISLLSGNAVIKDSRIADQESVGLGIGGNSHVIIENSYIVRNGQGMPQVAVWRYKKTEEGIEWQQTLEGLDSINHSGITLGGDTDPSTYQEVESQIILSIRGGAIQDNRGWGITAEITNCGAKQGYQKLTVKLELENVKIAGNNMNWLMEGNVCLP